LHPFKKNFNAPSCTSSIYIVQALSLNYNDNNDNLKGGAMMTKRNIDIREAIQASGFNHWLIAERMGVNDTTFSRWLRKELSHEKKQKILQVIEELKQEFTAVQ
jgi:hypothetical protein